MGANLEALFDEPILEQVYLDPGYSEHASDVWLVRTASGEAVARAFRRGEPDGPFWLGCRWLFGIDPGRVFDLPPLNVRLARLSPIPAPRVLRQGIVDGREWIVVERMPGQPLGSFRGQPPEMLEQLGQALAQIHSLRFTDYGSPSGAVRYPLDGFFTRVAETLRMLVGRFYSNDRQVAAALDPICRAAGALPPPQAAALVMVDMDASQFLADGDRLTALIDTEAYVVAPRELDFVGLEYVLDQPGATALALGYRTLLPPPDLSSVRTVCRYLYRLLEVQGQVDLDEWMGWPCLFDG